MRWVKDFELFLFDFDGLLVDTEKIHYLAYKKMCEEFNEKLDWSFKKFCFIAHTSSFKLKDSLRNSFPKLQQEEWISLYKRKNNIYQKLLENEKISLMEGVENLLGTLKNKKMCVVTNSVKVQTDIIKERIPILKKIPYWITREDYEKPKPSSQCYHSAILRYAKGTDRIIGFEDSLKGVLALIGTRAKPVLVCSPSHPQMLNIPKGVFHFSSLKDIDFT